jgi:preprotein translocase subunit YajC
MGAAIFILLVFGLLFAVLILPRQRELRRHQALVASLEVGQEVMTGTGIYGTIRGLDDDFVHLEVAPGVVMKLARRAVAAQVPAADAEGDGDSTKVEHEADGNEA